MPEEPRSAHSSQVDPATPAAHGRRPYPLWMLFGLGMLYCAGWLGATLLNQAALGALTYLSAWLLGALRVMLALAVPTLILCTLRSPRLPARRHARAFYIVEALVMALVALPALLTAPDLLGLPLLLPTMSLGVALAAVDPVVTEWRQARRDYGVEQWWEPKGPNVSTAIVAGAGFCAAFLVPAFIELSMDRCSNSHNLSCGSAEFFWIGFALGALLWALAALIGVWLGYLLGARIAQSDRWRDDLAR